MKFTRLFLLSALLAGTFAVCRPAYAQSGSNRIYRNCPATTTKASVAIDVSGNITLTPCSGKTTGFGSGDFNITNTSPSTPTSGINLGSGIANGGFVWRGTAGFSATLATTPFTGSRTFILPDLGGTFLLGTQVNLDRTITAIGTTGNQTINKTAGTINVAAAAGAVTLTNSLITDANTLLWTTIRTADATCTNVKSVVTTTGQAVITMNANCTAATSIGFWVTN